MVPHMDATITVINSNKLKLRFNNYALYLLDKRLGRSSMQMLAAGQAASFEFIVQAILAGLQYDPKTAAGMDEEKLCHILDFSKLEEYTQAIAKCIGSVFGEDIFQKEEDNANASDPQSESSGTG